MSGAFYRNTSSNVKKTTERERRVSSFQAQNEEKDAMDIRSVPGSGNVAKEEKSARHCGISWTVDITPSAIITLSVLSLILLSFSVVCGFVLGRATMPMPEAQELEQLLSEENREGGGEDGEEAQESILPKEELGFMRDLRSDQPAGGLSEHGKTELATQPEHAPAVQEKPKAEVSEPKEPIEEYVIRAATFKDTDHAQRLKDSLTKAGLRAKCIQTSTKKGALYYVQVVWQGTSADFQNTKEILDAAGLEDFMILSRKTVKK